MTTIGSVLPIVKSALVDLWTVAFSGSATTVMYDPPMELAEVGAALEFVYFADGSATSSVACSGTPVVIDEDASLTAVFEVLGPTSSSTQALVDIRANELLATGVGVVLDDPTCGVALATYRLGRLTVVPAGWELVTGPVANRSGHAARFEVDLSIEARLQHT